MLLLTSVMTLTSQLLNLSVLICQTGTMVLTFRVELRDANEKMHPECLVIRGSEEVFRKGGAAAAFVVVIIIPQELSHVSGQVGC